MATEHVLRLRITNAVKACEVAIARKDLRGETRARAAYAAADKELREIEAARNEQAIHELEMKAVPEKGGAYLSYAAIVDSGVPFTVLFARGWRYIGDARAGMLLPPKPRHLSVVREAADGVDQHPEEAS